uniref:Integral membrane protein TerC n=1 Tax=Solibacter usitatus (strain Ellin6076) TaxID=234267 RepID=Q01N97_SOLUE
MHFLLSALSLILMDLLLAGDNALVIALAVRSLPARERRIGIAGGATAAVVLRVGLTVVAAHVLTIHYLQIAGGLAILWIALKVLIDASGEPSATVSPKHFWQAIWYIMIADLTMSIDNILAIAGASRGDYRLILFGLAVSIPFVVFSSDLLSRLMDRFPVLIYIGAGLLGKVGGDMILTDPFVVETWHPTPLFRYLVDAALVVAVIAAGRIICRKGPRCEPRSE